MTILQVVAAGVLSAVLAITVKRQSPEIALMITITACVLIFFMILPALTEAVGILSRVGQLLNGGMKYVALALKVTGIAYMAELGAGVCADAGETAIASRIELGGRVLILAAATPVVLELVNLIMGIMP